MHGLFLVGVLVASGMWAQAFSLMGPLVNWMTPNLGYRDIGGPMDIDEGYRWTVPVITYAYDPTFLDYFGSNGVAAVESAVAILNAIPPASSIVLTNYPLLTALENYSAGAHGLWDLKTHTLYLLLKHMGLAGPAASMFCLRQYDLAFFWAYPDQSSWPSWAFPDYIVMRNFDPETLTPSTQINGEYYNAWVSRVGNALMVVAGANDTPSTSAVADGMFNALPWGGFFTGLTRDDIGGLKYLLSASTVNFENLPPDVHQTGTVSTNVIDGAWRQGIEKVTLTRQPSKPGSPSIYVPLVCDYTGGYLANGVIRHQHLERIISQPDILFCAADMGEGRPYTPDWDETRADAWVNNAASNWNDSTRAGPGVIQSPIRFTFQKRGAEVSTYDQSGSPLYLDVRAWGSFDGTTNAPVVYPATDAVLPPALTLRLRLSYNKVLIASHTWQVPVPVGGSATLQGSTNLVDWVPFGGAVTNTGAVIDWYHDATNQPSRFFRAVPK